VICHAREEEGRQEDHEEAGQEDEGNEDVAVTTLRLRAGRPERFGAEQTRREARIPCALDPIGPELFGIDGLASVRHKSHVSTSSPAAARAARPIAT